jgi:hypothetical protein
LALDNLLSAKVVLADSRMVDCDEHKNADLFWAIRGGGGNFGVITSMRVRLHPIRQVLAGMILFPWSQAESVLRGYAEAIFSAPDELSISGVVLSTPNGSPLVSLAPMWSGEGKRGEEFIARLRQLGTPVMDRVGTITYLDWLGLFAAAAPVGRYYPMQNRSLAALTPEVISTLVAGGQQRSSPFSTIILNDFRGAPTRVPLAATAFGLRKEHFHGAKIIAAWEPTAEDEGENHREWARTLSENLAPHALPGGYPNVLGPDDHEQTAHAYGANTSRLQQLKRRFDPDGVFASAISLPLQRAAYER